MDKIRTRRGVIGMSLVALAEIGLVRKVMADPQCREDGHPCEGNQECCDGLTCERTGQGEAKRCTNGQHECKYEDEKCRPGWCCDGLECVYPDVLPASQVAEFGVCRPKENSCSEDKQVCGALQECCPGLECYYSEVTTQTIESIGVCGPKEPSPCDDDKECGENCHCENGGCVTIIIIDGDETTVPVDVNVNVSGGNKKRRRRRRKNRRRRKH